MKAIVFAYNVLGKVGFEALLKYGYEICALVTHEDNPNEKIYFESVATLAEKKGIKVFRSFNQIPSMDLIFSSHVLEHLDNPLETLGSFHKKLSEGGVLILVIPKESHEKASFEPDIRNYHLYSWNFQTINNLLHKSGFKVIKNQISYGAAYHKLKFLSKISFSLYFLATKIIGRLFNRSELLIIARKV